MIAAGLAGGLLASVAFGGLASAAGEGNGHPSCMGIELSAISPPGTSDELADGAPEFVAEVRALAASFGWPPGAVDRLIAQTRAGSHDACDAES